MSIDRKLGAAAAYLRPGPDRKPGRIALSADVDGVEAFLARGDTKILRLILEHELIHKEQHRRTNWKPGKHRGTKSPGYSTRLLRKYCNNPQEIMAYAHNYVHGGEYSRAEMMQKITQGMRKGDAVFTWLSPPTKNAPCATPFNTPKNCPTNSFTKSSRSVGCPRTFENVCESLTLKPPIIV